MSPDLYVESTTTTTKPELTDANRVVDAGGKGWGEVGVGVTWATGIKRGKFLIVK